MMPKSVIEIREQHNQKDIKINFPEYMSGFRARESELLPEIEKLEAAYQGVLHDATAYSEELEKIEKGLNNLETFDHNGVPCVKQWDVAKVLLEVKNE